MNETEKKIFPQKKMEDTMASFILQDREWIVKATEYQLKHWLNELTQLNETKKEKEWLLWCIKSEKRILKYLNNLLKDKTLGEDITIPLDSHRKDIIERDLLNALSFFMKKEDIKIINNNEDSSNLSLLINFKRNNIEDVFFIKKISIIDNSDY